MDETGSHTEARILLVEDDQPLADVVEARLRIEGMSPTKCASSDALAALSSADFDAVILDLTVASAERDRVLRTIRVKAAMNELPVVVLAPKDGSIDGSGRELFVGACQTVTKPFSGQELIRKLRLSLVG